MSISLPSDIIICTKRIYKKEKKSELSLKQ